MKKLAFFCLNIFLVSALFAQGQIDLRDPQIPADILEIEQMNQAAQNPQLLLDLPAEPTVEGEMQRHLNSRADSLSRQIARTYWRIEDDLFQPEDSVVYDYFVDYLYNTFEVFDWDGTLWSKDYRYIYTYTAAKNTQSSTYQTFDGLDYIDESRTIYAYTPEGWTQSYTYQSSDMGVWENTSRTIIGHDAAGNATSYLSESWDGAAFQPTGQSLYTYNANGSITSYMYQSWDGAAFVNSNRTIYTYDMNDNRTGITGQTWDGAAWIDDYRYIYTFDASGNSTQQLIQDWDGANWVDDYRYVYTYNAAGYRTSYVYQDWDGASWLDQTRYIYTYNANNQRTSYERQNSDMGSWISDWRYIYTFNAEGQQTQFEYQDWIVGTGQWEGQSRSLYTYDGNGNYQTIIGQVFDAGSYSTNYQYNYYYEQFVGIKDLEAINHTVSPNPFSQTLTITLAPSAEVAVLTVYDLQGRQVGMSQMAPNSAQLQWEAPATLANGYYTYRLIQGGQAATGKVMLQR